MLEYEFEESVGYWVCMTSHLMERALNEELAPQGITFRQFQVLGWLALRGGMSQTELAERMNIEPPTLVGILDRMEREGWISREGCPDDRRRKIIRAQAKAEPVWSKMVASARRVRARATQGLDEHQLRTLMQLLAQVQENLNSESRLRQAAKR